MVNRSSSPLTWKNNLIFNLYDMKRATLINKVNGVKVEVHATTEHPSSNYGRAVWVDDEYNAYFEVGSDNPFYEVDDVRE